MYFRCRINSSKKKSLSNEVDEIKSAEWDIEVPGYKIKGKEWLKVKSQELSYQNIFLIMKNIYGLIVMHG